MKKPLQICIIDDDEIHKYTFARALKEIELPHSLLSFSDGEEAIQFIKDNIENLENIPDIIFLDINMPITDGFEFMEEYNKIKSKVAKKITTYLLTSSSHPDDKERAINLINISGYILKPLEPQQLSELLVKKEFMKR